jgi:hypothetical protein
MATGRRPRIRVQAMVVFAGGRGEREGRGV